MTAHVHRDDYPDPKVGDQYQDEELGLLELVEVVPAGDGFDLTYRKAWHTAPLVACKSKVSEPLQSSQLARGTDELGRPWRDKSEFEHCTFCRTYTRQLLAAIRRE